AAQAHDPFVFNVTTAGSFPYAATLGDPTAEIDPDTGKPIHSLAFLSNTTTGSNQMEIQAAFTSVSYNGKTLTGDLYHLTMGSTGIVSSSADLSVNFAPNSALGLSDDQITQMDRYIQRNLVGLDDGSVGLAAGSVLPLFGPGSPIDSLANLTLDYQPGTVT